MNIIAAFLGSLGCFLVIFDCWKGGINNPIISLWVSIYAILPAVAYGLCHIFGAMTTIVPYTVLSSVWVLIFAVGMMKTRMLLS
jgi:VIT1/CCC1 family predicted Fe2+/Mn2+ transporter